MNDNRLTPDAALANGMAEPSAAAIATSMVALRFAALARYAEPHERGLYERLAARYSGLACERAMRGGSFALADHAPAIAEWLVEHTVAKAPVGLQLSGLFPSATQEEIDRGGAIAREVGGMTEWGRG